MLRAFQWDLARQVERLDVLLDRLPRYADWGYQQVYLHLEDAVDYPSLPGVARADAYRWRDVERLVTAASRVGLGVVPIVNLLGHTQYLIKTERWRDLNECRAPDGTPLPSGQLCPLHPELPDLVERLLRDTAHLCTAGIFHAGLDESFHLARCPRCRAEVAEKGLAGHFAAHVQRLHHQVATRGLRLGLWADMLALFPEAIPLLPRGLVAYDWYYYPFREQPKVEFYNFRPYDLVPALREQRITWWGCPMSGAFRFEPLPLWGDRLANLSSWWRRAHTHGAEGFLVTSWEAYRLALAAPTVVDAAAASLWSDRKAMGSSARLRRGLDRVFGPARAHAHLARRLLQEDAYPFSGYFEWEAHQRWDGGITLAEPRRLSRTVDRLRRPLPGLPPVLAASRRLRAYFAERALFLRQAADHVAALRRGLSLSRGFLRRATVLRLALREASLFAESLAEAQQAARVMWEDSRAPDASGQNEALLARDAERLHTWLDWLAAVQRDPAHARAASPVFGAWRLEFLVHNFAPAVQKVCVEAQQADGTWRELAGRHTIEFQARAAARTSRFARPFAVSIETMDTPLRLVLRGTGQVRLSGLRLFDGVTTRALTPGTLRLGQPAPTHGLPDPSAVTDVRLLRLRSLR